MDGRFELLERLGSGGMGLVWRARDMALHREVALKEVRPVDPASLDSDPAAGRLQRERVLREARALARLHHPHVVTIHQIIESADIPFPWIVMELVLGTSLQERLQQGALAPLEAARIGRGVLSALRAAHAAGIHHRDVKPANVLLRTDGSPVLTDFGIAALQDSTSLTATGDVIGSPEYIAPERLRGDESQTASDFWSLAMLLFVAVEGYHPLRRATTLATLAAVMSEPVPAPVRSGPLAPVLTAVLVQDPAARPSGEQLDMMLAVAEQDFGRIPAGESVQPPPPSPPPVRDLPPPTPASGTGMPDAPSSPSSSKPTRTRKMSFTILIAACAVAGIVAGTRLMAPHASNPNAADHSHSVATPSSGSSSAGATDPGASSSGSPSVSTVRSLVTPEGVKSAVAALSKEMGGAKVRDLTVYEQYADASAPAKSQGLYDRYEYHDGAASRSGPGGTFSSGDILVDLRTVNWDALPGLWHKAEEGLGIQKPTMRYIIVRGDIITGDPTMNLYLSDDYGGAYLEANLQGKVLRLYPRGS